MDSPPGTDPTENSATGFLIFVWTMCGISFVVLSARFYTVGVILKRIRLADYLMLGSYMCALVNDGVMTTLYYNGLGRHVFTLEKRQIVLFGRYSYFSTVWTIPAQMLGRVSFCYFLLDVVGKGRWRVSVWVCIVTQIFVNMCAMVVLVFQCGTTFGIVWSAEPGREQHCIPVIALRFTLYFFSSWNSATDLFLTILPAMLLRSLQMNRTKKLAAIILLSLSVFALVASLMKTAKLNKMQASQDLTYEFVELLYWVVAEIDVIIIAASVPLLNALVKKGVKKAATSLSGSRVPGEGSKIGAGSGSGIGQGGRLSGRITVQNTWNVRIDAESESAEELADRSDKGSGDGKGSKWRVFGKA